MSLIITRIIFIFIITRTWLSLVCIPAMMPFRMGRGLEGRHSSMSLSEPSSSGTSISESSSFTAENICNAFVKSLAKRLLLCDLFCFHSVCDWLSHRNFSSDPSPPPSICAASSSSCFQPPAMKRKEQTHIAIIESASECMFAQAFIHLSNLVCRICTECLEMHNPLIPPDTTALQSSREAILFSEVIWSR